MRDNAQLLKEIRQKFEEVHSRTDVLSRTDWTNAFMDALFTIGKSEYKVYSSSCTNKITMEFGGPEWLFDLCWSKQAESEDSDAWMFDYKGLKLICESEWNQTKVEILEDFLKLAVGKAEIKIMLVQFGPKLTFESILDFCRKAVNQVLYDDDATYILVGSGNTNKLKWEVIWNK